LGAAEKDSADLATQHGKDKTGIFLTESKAVEVANKLEAARREDAGAEAIVATHISTYE